MSERRPPEGYFRFFARFSRFEIACPRCDRTVSVGDKTSRRVWDPRTSRFRCPQCEWSAYLGVVAWPCRAGTKGKIGPDDQTPTVGQANQLRAELSIFADASQGKTRWSQGRTEGQDTNVLVDEDFGWTPDQVLEQLREEQARRQERKEGGGGGERGGGEGE